MNEIMSGKIVPIESIEMKRVKTFVGMEGRGYNADLYLNGVKSAEVIDDASGGEVQIEWNRYHRVGKGHVERVPFTGISILGGKAFDAEASFKAYCKSLPYSRVPFTGISILDCKSLPYLMDIVMEEVLNWQRQASSIQRRINKGGIVYLKDGDAAGTFRELKLGNPAMYPMWLAKNKADPDKLKIEVVANEDFDGFMKALGFKKHPMK